MNNFINSLGRFFKNKNTITILGVIIIVVLLYFGYSYQINKEVTPMTVPIAAKTIQPGTMITADMISELEIPGVLADSNIYTSSSLLVGKYASYDTVIPAGSLFYQEVVLDFSDLPNAVFVEVPDGQYPYRLAVNMYTTYANSIRKGNIIDIYMKAYDDSGKLIVGKLLENVEILAVKDSSGKNVTSENGSPAHLIFGVDEDLHLLLLKAGYLSIDMFPIVHGGNYTGTGEMRVTTKYLQDYINAKTLTLPTIPAESNTQTPIDNENLIEETETTTDNENSFEETETEIQEG